jgi:hypothetical protein
MGGIFDLIRKVVRHRRLPAEIFGDFPFVCEEMRRARSNIAGGGATEHSGRADTTGGDSHFHRGGAFNR